MCTVCVHGLSMSLSHFFQQKLQLPSNTTFHGSGSTVVAQKVSILIYQTLDLTFIRLVPLNMSFYVILVGKELCYPHSQQSSSGKQ